MSVRTLDNDLRELDKDQFFDDVPMGLSIDETRIGGSYWVLRWGLDFENCPVTTVGVTVTRTESVENEDDTNIWEIFPDGPACLGEQVGGKLEFRGLYDMPFLMMLERRQ